MSGEAYFQRMSAALRAADIHQPCIVLDLDRLDRNIAAVKAQLAPGIALRIVDKSLPSLPLLAHVKEAFGTHRIMTFHPPVSAAVLAAFGDAELLFGKPMPVALARRTLADLPAEAAARIVWLIDTPARLVQYAALATEIGRDLRFCFEVDVGLHRGGLPDPDALASALSLLESHKRLRCEGLMAYEAHIGHIPKFLGGPEKARARAVSLFRQYVALLAPAQRSILNLGGSSTALLHDAYVGANEVSIGSAFVKPTDFDVPNLAALEPAIFLTAPVLKVVDVQLPGLDGRSRLAQQLGLLPRRGCYLYGGKWMAEPVHPAGMKPNATLGLSTNQQFFALPRDAAIAPDDHVFLRPTQSEFMLQQFGTIRVLSGDRIVDQWPALPMA